MSYELYKVLHVTGLALLLLGLGGLLFASKEQRPRLAIILHGTGAIVMAVAGFGILAKLNMSSPGSWPGWLMVKIVLFVVVALLPTLLRKEIVPRGFGWILVAALVFGGAWLAIAKP